MPAEKYFAPLRILYAFKKSLVSSFVDIALSFFVSSFNSFSATECFVLFEVTINFFFVYHQNLLFLRNYKYHLCLLNLLVLMLQQSFLLYIFTICTFLYIFTMIRDFIFNSSKTSSSSSS